MSVHPIRQEDSDFLGFLRDKEAGRFPFVHRRGLKYCRAGYRISEIDEILSGRFVEGGEPGGNRRQLSCLLLAELEFKPLLVLGQKAANRPPPGRSAAGNSTADPDCPGGQNPRRLPEWSGSAPKPPLIRDDR